jgi:hypothetical protein
MKEVEMSHGSIESVEADISQVNFELADIELEAEIGDI